MSILHTLAPVRSGDESGDSDDFYTSPSAAGRHVSADGADMLYGRLLKGVVSAWMASPGTVTGRFPFLPPGRGAVCGGRVE
ncbi:hypothetical protein EVAR_64715_1 [Eumeta japonica]|uniref:Uncharacterized protein n=1 Tax=Eumeta variegata TaxID=151549 RepID=A0A4C1ZQ87_EUMVA|nr:hypothetical protein EVAR_64715_1 [Eumeta japonica]